MSGGPGIVWTCSSTDERRVWFWEAPALMKHVGGMLGRDGLYGHIRPLYAPPRYVSSARAPAGSKADLDQHIAQASRDVAAERQGSTRPSAPSPEPQSERREACPECRPGQSHG